jgi:hypothetical protein
MAGARYRACQFDGCYHHPDELIWVPEGEQRENQKCLCLDHAQDYYNHLIKLAECRYQRGWQHKAA